MDVKNCGKYKGLAQPSSGGPGRSRTADQQFRKLLLYPTELRGLLLRLYLEAAGRQPVLSLGEFWRSALCPFCSDPFTTNNIAALPDSSKT